MSGGIKTKNKTKEKKEAETEYRSYKLCEYPISNRQCPIMKLKKHKKRQKNRIKNTEYRIQN